jgi:peptidoglycan/LPS O-acetylase OafA/YrhL
MLTHNIKNKWYIGFLLIFICLLCSRHLFMLVLAGGMICFYEAQVLKIFKTWLSKLLLLLCALFLGGMLNTDKEAIAHSIYRFTLDFPVNAYPYFHAMSAILILVLIVSSRKMKSVFSGKYLVMLGKLCFSIYLLHLPILYCIGSRLMWMSGGKIHPLLLFFSCLAVTLLLAFPFYYFIDKLSIRFSNKLAMYVLN